MLWERRIANYLSLDEGLPSTTRHVFSPGRGHSAPDIIWEENGAPRLHIEVKYVQRQKLKRLLDIKILPSQPARLLALAGDFFFLTQLRWLVLLLDEGCASEEAPTRLPKGEAGFLRRGLTQVYKSRTFAADVPRVLVLAFPHSHLPNLPCVFPLKASQHGTGITRSVVCGSLPDDTLLGCAHGK